jgi:hypothetical protein
MTHISSWDKYIPHFQVASRGISKYNFVRYRAKLSTNLTSFPIPSQRWNLAQPKPASHIENLARNTGSISERVFAEKWDYLAISPCIARTCVYDFLGMMQISLVRQALPTLPATVVPVISDITENLECSTSSEKDTTAKLDPDLAPVGDTQSHALGEILMISYVGTVVESRSSDAVIQR